MNFSLRTLQNDSFSKENKIYSSFTASLEGESSLKATFYRGVPKDRLTCGRFSFYKTNAVLLAVFTYLLSTLRTDHYL